MRLEEKVITIVHSNLEKKPVVTLSKNIVEDLGADSLDIMVIINALEDEFNIEISENDFKDIKTVEDIVKNLRLKFPDLE